MLLKSALRPALPRQKAPAQDGNEDLRAPSCKASVRPVSWRSAVALLRYDHILTLILPKSVMRLKGAKRKWNETRGSDTTFEFKKEPIKWGTVEDWEKDLAEWIEAMSKALAEARETANRQQCLHGGAKRTHQPHSAVGYIFGIVDASRVELNMDVSGCLWVAEEVFERLFPANGQRYADFLSDDMISLGDETTGPFSELVQLGVKRGEIEYRRARSRASVVGLRVTRDDDHTC